VDIESAPLLSLAFFGSLGLMPVGPAPRRRDRRPRVAGNDHRVGSADLSGMIAATMTRPWFRAVE